MRSDIKLIFSFVVLSQLHFNVWGQELFIDSLRKQNIDTIALFYSASTLNFNFNSSSIYISWQKKGEFYICKYVNLYNHTIKKMNEKSKQIELYKNFKDNIKTEKINKLINKNILWGCEDCESYKLVFLIKDIKDTIEIELFYFDNKIELFRDIYKKNRKTYKWILFCETTEQIRKFFLIKEDELPLCTDVFKIQPN